MKQLRVIVPLNDEALVQPNHREVLGTLGLEAHWLTEWVLYQWSMMRNPTRPEVYDLLYNDVQELLPLYDEDEGTIRKLDHYLEEHMEDLAEAAQGVYTKLAPYVGNMPNRLFHVQYENFGLNDMVLTFDLEAA